MFSFRIDKLFKVLFLEYKFYLEKVKIMREKKEIINSRNNIYQCNVSISTKILKMQGNNYLYIHRYISILNTKMKYHLSLKVHEFCRRL